MVRSYPLSWPDGWQRTPPSKKKYGHFHKTETRYSSEPGSNASWRRKKDISVMDGVNRILQELGRIGVRTDDAVISSNIPTRFDGLPRSDQKQPDDPGVAVYWRKGAKGAMQCIAIDIYRRVEDNLAAVAATLEALRAIERHGGAQVQERSFRGFAALPETTRRPWRDVLDIPYANVTREQVETRYRTLAKTRHPDVIGGTTEAMAELNVAREEALKEVAA